MNGNIIIDTATTIVKLALSDIIFIEKLGRQAIIVTDKEEIILYKTMDQLRQIFKDERFLKCHRSYIINMDRIERMDARKIWLSGGYDLEFGRESYRRARNIFLGYIEAKRSK